LEKGTTLNIYFPQVQAPLSNLFPNSNSARIPNLT
jgi:hypothetical protein